MGADGAVFALRSTLYPDFPDTVLDDLTVSMNAIFDGMRLVKDDAVVGYEEIVTDQSKDFGRRVRISMRAFHTHLWLRPKIATMGASDRWRYWSHRYIRWFAGGNLILSLLSLAVAIAVIDPRLSLSFIG